AGLKFMQRGGFGQGADDLTRYADEISRMKDPAQQTARALEVFGRGGTKLLPFLKEGSDGIGKLREEARRLGLVMSEQDVQAAEAFGDQLGIVDKQIRMLKVQIGAALIPALSEALQTVINVTGGFIRFIKEHREAAIVVGIVGIALVAVGAAFFAAGTAALMMSAMITAAIHVINGAIWLFKVMNPELLL